MSTKSEIDSDERIEVSKEEYEHLIRLNLIHDLKLELLSWAKKQAWIIMLIITIVSMFGFNFVIEKVVENEVKNKTNDIENVLTPTRKAAIEAEIESNNARDALEKLKKEREEAQNALSELTSKAAELQEKLSGFESNIENIRAFSSKIQGQIEEMAKTDELSTNPEIKKKINDTNSFEFNSKFNILVFSRQENEKIGDAILNKLRADGYITSFQKSNLNEAKKQYSSGKIRLIYTESGKAVVADLEKNIKSLELGFEVIPEVNTNKLTKGDVQVIIY